MRWCVELLIGGDIGVGGRGRGRGSGDGDGDGMVLKSW